MIANNSIGNHSDRIGGIDQTSRADRDEASAWSSRSRRVAWTSKDMHARTMMGSMAGSAVAQM
eukprot:9354880-Pyramimonas_sp.AAC.1